jgi:serine/threonine-protein kinase HipA
VDDSDFALEEGLLPKKMAQTIIAGQFKILAEQVELKPKQFDQIMTSMMEHSEEVIKLTQASFLEEVTQRNYIQDYQYRLKQLQKIKS